MTKAAQDFEFWTGEDKTLTYIVTDTNGASVAMSGMAGQWVLQDEENSGSLIRLTTTSGIAMSGCTAVVTLAGSHTSGCDLDGTYYTEISACNSASLVSVLAWGWATIHRRAY